MLSELTPISQFYYGEIGVFILTKFNVKSRNVNTNKLQLHHSSYPSLYKQENQIHQLQFFILHKLTKTFTINRIFSIFKGKALKYISLILFLDTNIDISTALVYKTNRLGE
ncbi:hypothetical protein BCM0079_3095 [Bacillus cereus]|nr:hypothetical protein BCM0079_3095 [Bacillus cereus]